MAGCWLTSTFILWGIRHAIRYEMWRLFFIATESSFTLRLSSCMWPGQSLVTAVSGCFAGVFTSLCCFVVSTVSFFCVCAACDVYLGVLFYCSCLNICMMRIASEWCTKISGSYILISYILYLECFYSISFFSLWRFYSLNFCWLLLLSPFATVNSATFLTPNRKYLIFGWQRCRKAFFFLFALITHTSSPFSCLKKYGRK